MPEVWPSLLEIQDVQQLQNGGRSYRWVYKMAGMHFEGTGEITELVPNQQIVAKHKGGISSTLTWDFEPVQEGTRVNLAVDYSIPVPLLGKLAESFVVRQNENELAALVANLKARMET